MSVDKARPARAGGGGQVARVLTEAVDAVASPELRQRIFDRALAVSGMTAVPEGGRALLDFVDAYFRAALVSCLGEMLAEEVIAQVEPIVRMAAQHEPEPISEVRTIDPPALEAPRLDVSGERRIAPAARREPDWAEDPHDTPTKMPSDRATERAPEDFAARNISVPKASKAPTDMPPIELEPLEDPRSWVEDDEGDEGHEGDEGLGEADELIDLGPDRPHSEAPDFPDVVDLAMSPGRLQAVLFATPLSFLVAPFEQKLGGNSRVTHVARPLDILDGLDDNPGLTMVVLDCRAHDVDVATIATLLADRTPTPTLVLWGADEDAVEEVALASESLPCIAVDAAASVEALVERCLRED